MAAGTGVIALVILMGGDLHMFVNEHAAILIFGGARRHADPLSALLDFPRRAAGRKFAFTMRRMTTRELVDELADIAEIAASRPHRPGEGRMRRPLHGQSIRFVGRRLRHQLHRDNLERDRDNFLTHLDEGQKIYRAIGDCAPASA